MSYSWEGRCYSVEYGNRDLINIYLVCNLPEEMSYVDSIQNKIGDKILGIEKETNNEFHHVTLIVKEEDQAEVIKIVETYFKYV